MDRLAQGDREAFDALYLHYAPKVEELAFWMLKNRTEAEDVMQSIMLKVWERKEEIAQMTRFSNYLFTLSKPHAAKRFPAKGPLTVRVALTNTGSRSGAEVVQLYVSQRNPAVVRPKKELKAFRRVELAPGRSGEVEFELDRSALAYWDDRTHGWRVDPGEYVLSLGTSSADIAVELPVTVE